MFLICEAATANKQQERAMTDEKTEDKAGAGERDIPGFTVQETEA